RFPRAMRQQIKSALDARWAALATGRPPDDVAKFGAKTFDEAIVAYGLLRLSAIDGNADADAAADQILNDARDVPAANAGPARSAGRYGSEDQVVPDLIAQVPAAATAPRPQPPAKPLRLQRSQPRGPWWGYSREKAIMLGALALGAIAGLSADAPALFGTR